MTNMYRLVTSHLPQHQLPVNFMDHIFIPLCFVVASFLFIILTFPLTLISVKDAKQRKTGTRPKACLQRHCSRIFAPLSAIVTQLPSLVSITMVATWRRNRIVCMWGGGGLVESNCREVGGSVNSHHPPAVTFQFSTEISLGSNLRRNRDGKKCH